MKFDLLQLSISKNQVWLTFCGFETDWHQPALIHIERHKGYWKFDFLFLRELFRR